MHGGTTHCRSPRSDGTGSGDPVEDCSTVLGHALRGCGRRWRPRLGFGACLGVESDPLGCRLGFGVL